MTRPSQLRFASSFSGFHSQDQVLTPRTPHSRAGRAEEARPPDETELDDYEYQHQSEPLLTSSASDAFPHRQPPREHKSNARNGISNLNWPLILYRAPLIVGLITALFLLFLIIMSVEKPETLHSYLHDPVPSHNDQKPAIETTASLPSGSPTTTIQENGPEMLMPYKISYSQYSEFPLKPSEYREECSKYLASMKGPMGTYWHTPDSGSVDVEHVDDKQTDRTGVDGVVKTCSSTITYMLDGMVGLAADLALLAQVAGLAREQNRTLLIDDRYWNRGNWTDHFLDIRSLQPGPEPGCLPPPVNELVACPRTARHWIVNSRTALFHFGHHFMDEYENPYARELRRLKPIFQRAAYSFSHSLRPNTISAGLIQKARKALRNSYIAVHIRRGDRKPESWRYRGAYVPLDDYVQNLEKTQDRLLQMSPEANGKPVKVYIASDDPHSISEFQYLLNEERYESTEILTIETSGDKDLEMLASRKAYFQQEFNDLDEDERILSTRGAIVELALTSGLWTWNGDPETEGTTLEAVICTISSNFCKIAAVGQGWEPAFGFEDGDLDKTIMTMNDEKKRWVEIDNAGEIDPVWRAFELF